LGKAKARRKAAGRPRTYNGDTRPSSIFRGAAMKSHTQYLTLNVPSKMESSTSHAEVDVHRGASDAFAKPCRHDATSTSRV